MRVALLGFNRCCVTGGAPQGCLQCGCSFEAATESSTSRPRPTDSPETTLTTCLSARKRDDAMADLTARERADLLQVTKEDLLFLDALELESSPHTTADAALARVIQDQGILRAASVRLRRLVIEESILHVRQVLRMKGPPMMKFFLLDESSEASFLQSAGATRGGASITGLAFHDKALSPEEVREAYERSRERINGVVLNMSKWRRSVCMVVGGVRVSRDDVIKYVANKLGGVHLNSSRDPTTETAYIALDSAERVNALGLDSRYLEFLSIVQQFRSSPEVQATLQCITA